MALLKARHEHPEVEVVIDNEETFDLLGLRRLREHPAVLPLIERRATLRGRLDALAQERQRAAQALKALEEHPLRLAEGEAEDTAAWRDAKAKLAECDDQERLLRAAMTELDQLIDDAQHAARLEIEAELQRLRQPHVQGMIAALRALLPHNTALHALEAKSNQMLGYASYHLYNAGLGPWLTQLERSLATIERATQGGE